MANEKVVAVIPARGGSKRIRRKNMKLLDGKPLVYYSIVEALKSDYINRVIVSTEDEEIAKVAEEFGAEVVKRPKELARDTALLVDVIFHVLEVLKKKNQSPDIIVLLQPTSPLRIVGDIDKSIELLLKKGYESVVSVSEVRHSPYWSFKIEEGVLIPLFERKYLKMRRQELPRVYAPNGAVFVSRPEDLRRKRGFYSRKTIPYIMPAERSIDIDEETDLVLAEIMMKRLITPRR